MTKDAVFTMKLEPELRDAFAAEAAAIDRPASQIVRDLMRDFVQRKTEERSYKEFLQRKVDASRRSIAAGRTSSQEEVEAQVAARREEFLRRANEVGE